MSPRDPQAAALLAHIVSQMEDNLQFLSSQNYISEADASAILSKLPNVSRSESGNKGVVGEFTSRVKSLAVRSPPTPAPAPALPPRSTVQAKAVWAYNGQGSDELSFAAGDIIEIVEEVNADWWTGKVNGHQGLFPSNYVDKIDNSPVKSEKLVYKPFGAAYHGANSPPPPGAGVNSVGLQQVDQEQKKSKYGKLGNTMAHSAAGGVGFGAGAAIGGGLVRAIF